MHPRLACAVSTACCIKLDTYESEILTAHCYCDLSWFYTSFNVELMSCLILKTHLYLLHFTPKYTQFYKNWNCTETTIVLLHTFFLYRYLKCHRLFNAGSTVTFHVILTMLVNFNSCTEVVVINTLLFALERYRPAW